MKFKLRLVLKIQQLWVEVEVEEGEGGGVVGGTLTAVSRVLKRKLTARIFDLTKCMIYDSKCVPYKGSVKSLGTAHHRTHIGVAVAAGAAEAAGTTSRRTTTSHICLACSSIASQELTRINYATASTENEKETKRERSRERDEERQTDTVGRIVRLRDIEGVELGGNCCHMTFDLASD